MDVERLIQQARESVRALARRSFGRYARQASADAEQFIRQMESDLKRWAIELDRGEIDRDEFESLIESQRDLAQMGALKQEAVASVEIESFLNGILDIIVAATVNGTDSPGPQAMP